MSAKDSLPSHVQYWLSPDSKHDCHFIVGPESGPTERIGAFKAFLIGHSEPFRAMLEDSELAEKGDITIVDIKPETFRDFLKCLYMNCDNLTEDKFSFQDYVDLLHVSDKYLVTHLQEKLIKCLLSSCMKMSIGLDDIFTAMSSPVFLKEKCLEKMFVITIKSKINEILSSPSFLNVSSESLLWILKLDNVGTDDVTLWQGALKWATHQTGSKDGKVLRQRLLKHLKFVRFCTMSSDDFCQKVVPTNILTYKEVYEVCKAIGLGKPPSLEFICNNISFRHKINDETSFSYCVKKISDINGGSRSPYFKFLGLEWSILIRKDDNYLSFFLACKSPVSPYKCSVTGELILINHRGTNFSRTIDKQFCDDVPDWGFSSFFPWDEMLNPPPSKKYILNDSIVLLVHIVVTN